MSEAVLEFERVSKSFAAERSLFEMVFSPFCKASKICALKDCGFKVCSGEVLGLTGANGAGKTTLMKLGAGLLSADDGNVRFFGANERGVTEDIRSKIGFVSSDERSFFWRLSGEANLEFFARIYGLPERVGRERIAKLLLRFGVENKSGELFGSYSAGTRKKFLVMRALVHEPRILLMDEVTNSLDAGSAEMVKGLVRDYVKNGSGRVCLWSSHRMAEVVEMSDRVLELRNGRVEFYGDVKRWAGGMEEGIGRAGVLNFRSEERLGVL